MHGLLGFCYLLLQECLKSSLALNSWSVLPVAVIMAWASFIDQSHEYRMNSERAGIPGRLGQGTMK